MNNQISTSECPDCGASVPMIEGPVHPYFGSNAGCWRLYGEILEREYSDPRYMKVHRLTVDAYAAQHPGKNEPRSAQSVNVHLMALYLVFERGMSYEFATKALGKAVERKKHQFRWLPPPQRLGSITVLDVVRSPTPDEHERIVKAWANDVWIAWQSHWDEIERLANDVI